jgi:subtilisin family serine protease
MNRVSGLAAALLLLAGGTGCTARSVRLSVKAQVHLQDRGGATRPVPGEFVVIFGDGIAGIPLEGESRADADRRRQAFEDREAVEAALAGTGSEIQYRYSNAVIGVAGRLSPTALLAVRRASRGRARIEPNLVSLQDREGDMDDALPTPLMKTAAPAVPYGLDRIGQRLLDLNGTFLRPSAGLRQVHVYVIDSGILRTHSEFGSRVGLGYNAYSTAPSAACLGHGTHVAGTIGGNTMGVAPFVLLHSVRVIDCSNAVSSKAAIAGVDWTLAQVKSHSQASVANMSLEFDVKVPGLDSAVRNSIKAGITYVVAAGNRNYDACTVSPAWIPQAITVASTNPGDDSKAGKSGGPCVDLFAPGVGIRSATSANDSAYSMDSGTSFAAPHVTGVAALVLSRYSGSLSAATPPAVWAAILAAANVQGTNGWCGVGNRGTAYNRLLHWGAGSPPYGTNDSETGGSPTSCNGKQ